MFYELACGLARACAMFGRAGDAYYLPARDYIARGYWRAVGRWAGYRLAANRQFAAITVACAPWVELLEAGGVAEGARLVLTYGDGEATMALCGDPS